LETGKEVRHLTADPAAAPVTQLAASGGRAVCACSGGQLRLLELTAGREIRILGEPAPAAEGKAQKTSAALLRLARAALSAAVSADRRAVAIRSGKNTVRLWETATNQERARFQGHDGPITCMELSDDGHYLVTGSQDGTVLVWAVGVSPAVKAADVAGLENMW